jgi:hypothetical protein
MKKRKCPKIICVEEKDWSRVPDDGLIPRQKIEEEEEER